LIIFFYPYQWLGVVFLENPPYFLRGMAYLWKHVKLHGLSRIWVFAAVWMRPSDPGTADRQLFGGRHPNCGKVPIRAGRRQDGRCDVGVPQETSLPLRASLAVTVIALLAITTTLTAGLLAWVSEEDASAINNAGSLRMASYRLNWLIAQESTDLNPSLRDLDARLQRLQRYQQASINQTPEDGPPATGAGAALE
jgi:hypothetical protein